MVSGAFRQLLFVFPFCCMIILFPCLLTVLYIKMMHQLIPYLLKLYDCYAGKYKNPRLKSIKWKCSICVAYYPFFFFKISKTNYRNLDIIIIILYVYMYKMFACMKLWWQQNSLLCWLGKVAVKQNSCFRPYIVKSDTIKQSSVTTQVQHSPVVSSFTVDTSKQQPYMMTEPAVLKQLIWAVPKLKYIYSHIWPVLWPTQLVPVFLTLHLLSFHLCLMDIREIRKVTMFAVKSETEK